MATEAQIEAGERATCPVCGRRAGCFGVAMIVRVNPRGTLQTPSHGWHYAWNCRGCKTGLEFRPATALARAA